MRSAILSRAAVRKWALPIAGSTTEKIEQLSGRFLRVPLGQLPYPVKVVVEGGQQRMVEQMIDKLMPRVEHAAGLAPARLGLVVELRLGHLRLLAGAHGPKHVLLGVVCQIFGRPGQLQREQRLVDGSEVPDLQAGVIQTLRLRACPYRRRWPQAQGRGRCRRPRPVPAMRCRGNPSAAKRLPLYAGTPVERSPVRTMRTSVRSRSHRWVDLRLSLDSAPTGSLRPTGAHCAGGTQPSRREDSPAPRCAAET